LKGAWRIAVVGVRSRRRRALLTGIGIALAAAMLSAAVLVSYGLGTGFARATRAAGLPDIIARFDNVSAQRVSQRIEALPDVARFAFRLELDNGDVDFRGRGTGAIIEVLDRPGRQQGYALVAGRNLSSTHLSVLVEKAFADAWHIHVGSTLEVGGLSVPVAGLVEGPDDVGYPLAKARVYLSRPALDARFGRERSAQVDLAEIWLRNPAYLNEVLVQARSVSYGLKDIQFATRGGIQILLSQAAGIVIDLLVALSLIALVTAGVLLSASARAEVQRRVRSFGVRAALGETRGHLVAAQVIEGLIVSVPFGSLGVATGILATSRSADRLLELLNEPAPGWGLWWPILLAWLAAVAFPALGASWPAWRATRGPAAPLLQGGDLSAAGGSKRLRLAGGGLVGLGVRLVFARRARWLVGVVTLGLSAAFVLLMLALASELSSLQTDPQALGEKYQLTTSLPPPNVLAEVRRIPGIEAASPRYEITAADSFSLGETIDTIAFAGNPTRYEAPQLVSGRRVRRPGEADVGEGLANALGLDPGSVLALALPSGQELRVRVAGIVSSLDHEGRVAYLEARTLLAADPSAASTGSLAIILAPSANAGRVTRELAAIGAPTAVTAGPTATGAPLVAVLRAILRALAVVDGLVCLYALIQACALTVFERRRTVAVLRACGAGAGAIRLLLSGAVAALVVPAAVVGVLLERVVFGPALSRLAINYAILDLAAGPVATAAVCAGLCVAGGIAVGWVARGAGRESVVTGLGS
jgi:hypothetical protein